jgi:hypothetical protein
MRPLVYSFWNYLGFCPLYKKAPHLWAEAGMNAPQSFVYDPSVHKKEDVLSFLDICEKEGMEAIIVDRRTSFKELLTESRDEFRAHVREAYEDFGHHPAALGFAVGDEPDFDHVDDFIFALRTVREEMPGLTPFGNLLPYWSDGSEVCHADDGNTYRFEEVVAKILKETGSPVIGFDQYTQCFDSESDQAAGIDHFLFALSRYVTEAKRHGADIWVSLLAVGHWGYREPSEDDIRWQMSVSFALGARGIVWFYFHQAWPENSTRGAVFVGEDGLEMPVFGMILREQRLFQKGLGKRIDEASLSKASFLNGQASWMEPYKPSGPIKAISSKRGHLSIVSEFVGEGGERFLTLTNADQKTADFYHIEYADGSKKDVWVMPGEMYLLH